MLYDDLNNINDKCKDACRSRELFNTCILEKAIKSGKY